MRQYNQGEAFPLHFLYLNASNSSPSRFLLLATDPNSTLPLYSFPFQLSSLPAFITSFLFNPTFHFLFSKEKSMVGLCQNTVPYWMEALLGERFFQPCSVHESARKNERNILCLDCGSSFCPHCISPHRSHRLIQVRRYVYQDVIRLDDVEKLFDCGFVQSYTTNSAKVVFIKERPQTRPFRLSGHVCITCDRPLQEPYVFCSLSCKVKHILTTEGSISKYLYECDFLPLSSPSDADDGHLTSGSVLDSPDLSGSATGVDFICPTLPDVVVRRKRSVLVGSSTPVEVSPPARSERCWETVSRRKGAPSRSPLY